tara:strand:- start:12443 stop:13939 length:1497 start_codon:yes stop_codon:yes gene_type:complete
MKKFNIYILIGLLGILSMSCEDFLDKQPLDQISSETFWKDESDADMALAGVYSQMRSNTLSWDRNFYDALSDNSFARNAEGGNVSPLAQGIIEPSSGGLVSSVYNAAFTGISRCNIFLQNIDNVEMEETKKNIYKGEVLFLRAYLYFTLTQFYGGVPLYITPPTIEESKVKQSTKETVINQVLADLDEAIGYLPDDIYDGHAVKGSALSLKAKILLHQEKWVEAAETANLVIQSGTFSLSSSYPDLFLAAGQENNPEIIFSTKFLNPDYNAWYGPDIRIGWWSSLNPFQNLVDEYECTDGLSISESPLYNPVDPRENRDPRLSHTIRFWNNGIEELIGGSYDPGGVTETGYFYVKYVDPNNAPFDYSIKSEQDFIHLRYADVLLMYAEAKNEASGPDANVYSAINNIRDRVDMPPLPADLTKDQMRERIRHESRVELAMEGHRYFDLKRWKTIENIIPAITDPGGNQRQFDPAKHYLFPFPQSEIDRNENLDQNPGYN